jgi:hypothetical protein
MTLIEIRSGLRKLEFDAAEGALVEFVSPSPLAESEAVRVQLGFRNGKLREIVGRPELIETASARRGERGYRYRLCAPIVTAPNRSDLGES